MSSAFACEMTCSSALPGSAPACWNRITFSRNTISVGMERMPKEPASSCCSSVFTLANTTSGCSSEAFSYTGAKPLHGPHQGAQKSMITIAFSLTVCSKLSLVRSTVATTLLSAKGGQCTLDTMYVGRFAPSPTGPLHFGSLAAALASWLDARAARGRWLLRIEDLDAPRTQPGAVDDILRTLERFGLTWDGPVIYQSLRGARYEAALQQLRGRTYWCGCSRREIADSAIGLAADGAQIYPGTCRSGLPAGRAPRALRIRTEREPISFEDRVQGAQQQSVQELAGDFVLYR